MELNPWRMPQGRRENEPRAPSQDGCLCGQHCPSLTARRVVYCAFGEPIPQIEEILTHQLWFPLVRGSWCTTSPPHFCISKPDSRAFQSSQDILCGRSEESRGNLRQFTARLHLWQARCFCGVKMKGRTTETSGKQITIIWINAIPLKPL